MSGVSFQSGTDRPSAQLTAASRTSGSQSPATSFALAAGNTNPQGIADPPASAGGDTVAIRNTDTAGSGVAAGVSASEAATESRRNVTAMKLRAIDFVLSNDDQTFVRRARRVGHALHALLGI